MAAIYRNFRSQAELDAEYDVERAVPDFPAYVERFNRESERAIATLKPSLGIPYGPTVAEHLDIYPVPCPRAPVAVFFHGGYWRMLSSRDFAFVALGLAPHGIVVVNVNYAHCPHVTIDEIVREARSAVSWTYRHIADYGGDPDRIFVAGQSAGAHLAAMCLLAPWDEDYALPPDLLQAGVLISGLYDLSPLPFTFVQPALQLTARQILQTSPLLLARRIPGSLLVTYGDAESPEFRRQSTAFAAAWGGAGNAAPQVLVQQGRNHFSAVLDLADPATPLVHTIAGLAGRP